MAFRKGDPNINRAGRPKNSEIDQLRIALVAEGKKRGKDFWEEVAKKAFTHDKIMLAVMKKLVPDLTSGSFEGEIKYTAMSVVRIEARPLGMDLGEDIPAPIQKRMGDDRDT